MKKILLFGLAVLFGVMPSNAQLKVISNGNVGVGLDNPLEKLHINGSLRGNQTAGSVNFQTDYGYMRVGAINGSFAHFYTNLPYYYFDKGINSRSGQFTSYTGTDLILCTSSNFTSRLIISNSNGNVGIGANPSSTARLYVAGDISLTGTVMQSSDIRLKENIRPMILNSSKIKLLQPIIFNFKMAEIDQNDKDTTQVYTANQKTDKAFSEKTRFGFSAQEVQKVFPELVEQDENGYLSVDYMGLIPVLVGAMKEQQSKIDELEKQVAALNSIIKKK